MTDNDMNIDSDNVNNENIAEIRRNVIAYCLTLCGAYEDYPFYDENWTVIRHGSNHRVFAWIFERQGHIWVNVKCEPEWRDFWRSAFEAVVPAYHLNKTHWNSVILDGSIPRQDVERMIEESYELTKSRQKANKKQTKNLQITDEEQG